MKTFEQFEHEQAMNDMRYPKPKCKIAYCDKDTEAFNDGFCFKHTPQEKELCGAFKGQTSPNGYTTCARENPCPIHSKEKMEDVVWKILFDLVEHKSITRLEAKEKILSLLASQKTECLCDVYFENGRNKERAEIVDKLKGMKGECEHKDNHHCWEDGCTVRTDNYTLDMIITSLTKKGDK